MHINLNILRSLLLLYLNNWKDEINANTIYVSWDDEISWVK